MVNEQLLVLLAIVDLCLVFVAARFGMKWLVGTIVMNLLLVTIFGAKLISVFGLVTNAGNVFYACVFFATHFILERGRREEGIGTIWLGSVIVGFFLAMAVISVEFISYVPGDAVQTAMKTLFEVSPRIALASILAYVFAQYVNVHLYTWICEHTQGKFLWLRSNAANIVGQLVDSCLFFTIAFLDMAGPALVQAIFAGWLVKSIVVLLGTPLLYLDTFLTRRTKP